MRWVYTFKQHSWFFTDSMNREPDVLIIRKKDQQVNRCSEGVLRSEETNSAPFSNLSVLLCLNRLAKLNISCPSGTQQENPLSAWAVLAPRASHSPLNIRTKRRKTMLHLLPLPFCVNRYIMAVEWLWRRSLHKNNNNKNMSASEVAMAMESEPTRCDGTCCSSAASSPCSSSSSSSTKQSDFFLCDRICFTEPGSHDKRLIRCSQ